MDSAASEAPLRTIAPSPGAPFDEAAIVSNM